MVDSRDMPNYRWYPKQPDDIDREQYEHDLSGTIALLYPREERIMDVKKIREALHGARGFLNIARSIYGIAVDPHITKIDDALAALSTIDPDAIRRECADKAKRAILSAPSDIVTRAYAASLSEEAIVFSEPAQDDGKAEICESSDGFVEPNSRDMQIADKVRRCTLGVGAAIVVAKYRAELKRRIEEAKE